MAASLGLSMGEPKSLVLDVIFEVVHRDTSPVIALPFSSVLLQAVQATWVHPASAPTSTKTSGPDVLCTGILRTVSLFTP